jgi:hypothetical protein
MDIYSYRDKHHELFAKNDLQDFGAGDLGFIWETDPVKHRDVGKKLLPRLQQPGHQGKGARDEHLFGSLVQKMKDCGSCPGGLLMNEWLLWLGVDMAGDLAYSREMRHLKNGQTFDVINSIRGTSFPMTLIQLSNKIRLIALLAPLFVPLRVMRSITAFYASNSAAVKARIDKRGSTKHPDFMIRQRTHHQPLRRN